MAGDEEFPPLIESGLSRMTIGELRALVVDRFPRSTQRRKLWDNFSDLVRQLEDLGIRCDIWVDGSFLTEKLDPSDVDFVVDVPIDLLASIDPKQKSMLEALNRRDFRREKKLHSFVMFKAPLGHTFFPKSQQVREQWQRDFGQSYITKQPKGIAVVEVNP